MGGGSFGSVIGVALGGVIAVNLGWRWSFAAMAVFGSCSSPCSGSGLRTQTCSACGRRRPGRRTRPRRIPGADLEPVHHPPAVVFAYIGGGLQMFTAGVLLAWLPSFFNRSYGLALDKAGAMASIFVLLVGSGMVVCGIITDRVSRNDPARKWTTAVVFGVISLVFLGAGFQLPTGAPQLVLIGIGAFFSAGSSGPIAAMVANLTHSSVRASAFGTLTLANNLLGLALGPSSSGCWPTASAWSPPCRSLP